MPTLGISTKAGTCAICDKPYKKANLVYHDPFKSLPRSVVHADCWTTLCESRGTFLVQRGKDAKLQSKVTLDPPF